MIDLNDVTFTTGNVHIKDSYRYSREEVSDFLVDAKQKHPGCLPLQKRSKGSLLREWATHKAAWLLGYKRDHTASVDLNHPQRWWIKILYFICGSFVLILEYMFGIL